MSLAGSPRYWRTLLVASVLAWATVLAAADRPTVPVDGMLRATLKNGLRVVIVRNPLAPVVAVEVNYLVGSNEAPEGFPGMAHAQEHMMFRGSPGLSAGQLAYLDAAMGGMANANTQFTVTQYSTSVPAEDLTIVLQIEAIRMRDVLDSNELWQQERGAIEQEVAQDLSSPDYVLYTKLLEGLFSGTPYAHDALGTRPSFDKTTGALLKAFYDAWYAPNNAILVIVGDVQPRQVLDEVQRLFGPIPARKLPKRPPIRLQPVLAQRLELKTDHANGTVVIAFRMPSYDSPDYPAAQLLANALDSERAALFDLVVNGKALSTSFDMETMPQAGFGYAAADFPQGVDAAALVRQVQELLKRYAENGVPEDLVEAAKRREVTELELQKNSVSGLAEAWSQALAVEGRESPQDDIEAMQRVSVADVNRGESASQAPRIAGGIACTRAAAGLYAARVGSEDAALAA
jgi:zinc protease